MNERIQDLLPVHDLSVSGRLSAAAGEIFRGRRLARGRTVGHLFAPHAVLTAD